MHVLIVEDDAGIQNFYDRILQQIGYEVHIAMDGEQAIEHLQEHVPNLVVLDIRLPYINGLHILDFIAQNPRLSQTHVIIATASQEYEQYVTKVNSADFLLKPIMPKQIIDIATRIIQEQTASS